MFTQMGTSGNLPFIYSLLFALSAFPCFCFLWRLLYIFFHPGIPSFFLSAAVYFFSFSLITCAVSWCSWLSHHFYVVRVPGSNPGGTIYCSHSPTCSDQYHAAMLINFSKKQRREVSINRPASYEPAALPLRYPAFTSHVLCFFAPPFFIFFPFVFSMKMNIKFHRRESNPGRKRERLACYQLHHNGHLDPPALF